MKPTVKLRKVLFLVSVGSIFALGCELIVDFDRTKIPVEDAGTVPGLDGAPVEAGGDTGADAPAELDGGPDADADADAPADADADG